MKRKYMYLFCLFLLIPVMIEAKTITDYIPMLEENRIITEIPQSSVGSESYLNCAENIFIPYQFVAVIRVVIQIIKVGVPIILIIVGMLDFGKVVLGKPDEQLKKSWKNFSSRIVCALFFFLVVSVVEMGLPMIEASDGVLNCFSCAVKDTDHCKYVDISYPKSQFQ